LFSSEVRRKDRGAPGRFLRGRVLWTAVDAGPFDYPSDATEDERQFDYSFGLDRILDGVATLIGPAR
jgi:hypothetical protein